MDLLAWTLSIGMLAAPAAAPASPDARLSELVVAVRSADYRGNRADLDRLDVALGDLRVPALADYRDYWRGFARWRRALNGFNETPMPADLTADLERAVVHFRAALERRPDWIEAKLALVGCWGNLIYLAGEDADRKKTLLAEATPTYKWLMENGHDNPRALWIIGGMEMSIPPPRGGDLVKAAASLRRGVQLAWQESLSGTAPAWVPRWGGPENLMNLAYMYSHGKTPDRTAALAYAEGAVTAVPEWHYVRDIMLPQIEALPEAVAAN